MSGIDNIPPEKLRLMFMGMGGPFSAIPLKHLLQSDTNICAVVTPGCASSGQLPLLQEGPPATIVDLALARAIPVETVDNLKDASTLARLAAYRPHVILVACFPYIFPPALLQLPPLGCVNLHPSLLPAYRGPSPLFWQFRQGERQTGVTLHLMNERPDAGHILLQRAIPLDDGASGPATEALLAEQGGQLMLEALRLMGQNRLTPQPQDEAAGSYHPWPAAQDFQIPTRWSAQRAFNFIRGTQDWGHVYEIIVNQARFAIQSARSYSKDHSLDRPYVSLGPELWVQFSPGVLRARKL